MEKMHAAVARSTFSSQNAKKLLGFAPLLQVSISLLCVALALARDTSKEAARQHSNFMTV